MDASDVEIGDVVVEAAMRLEVYRVRRLADEAIVLIDSRGEQRILMRADCVESARLAIIKMRGDVEAAARRDLFAAAALRGMVSSLHATNDAVIAERAYRIADAMEKAR